MTVEEFFAAMTEEDVARVRQSTVLFERFADIVLAEEDKTAATIALINVLTLVLGDSGKPIDQVKHNLELAVAELRGGVHELLARAKASGGSQ
jgi:hypothetical protein